MSPPAVLAGAASATQGLTFWLLAIVSVAAALGMVLARRAVHCAVLLAVVMLCLAVLYALAGAPFLAFVQVIVYTGAVLMLFLFVLMMVGVTASDSIVETIRGQRLWAGLAGIGLLVLLALTVGHALIGPAASTSALLITAALGAMVLAHRERTTPKPTQRELARQRVASGRPAPLPGPGTYARHNAVDMPALLPDGSPAPGSVSPVITRRAEPGQRALGGVAPGPGEGGSGDGGPGEPAQPLPSEADAGGQREEARW